MTFKQFVDYLEVVDGLLQKGVELQQLIFRLFETQIKFGVHRYGESLPTIKEASGYFLASVDTVRLAYVQLKQEGYISLSTGVGAKVKVCYTDEEFEQHIQSYFSNRRDALLAFAQAVGPIANYTQWFALKNASQDVLDELEQSCTRKDIPPVYRMSQQFQLIYAPLGNDLLLHLYWQMLLFFQAPLVSVPRNSKVMNSSTGPLPAMIRAVREKDWAALRDMCEWTVKQYDDGLRRYFAFLSPKAGDEPVDFTWNIYKKASQVCYTLCLDLLIGIHEGRYPAGSFLPSPKELALENQVDVKTIRRTISLLNKLGATETVNGVGTRVLFATEYKPCDFTDTTIRKRLLDFVQSLHIAAFSCRACLQDTLAAMDAASRHWWGTQLEQIRLDGDSATLFYVCYEAISRYAPYPAIRTVYSELKRQLFWGFPLRPHGETANAYFLPYAAALLEAFSRKDAAGFSKTFEELQIMETKRTAEYLLRLGITEAGALRIPDGNW